MSTHAASWAPSHWRAALAGAAASLVGIGLARFAYTPLLPAIISAHWFSASGATYLGAANLAGYLLGVMLAALLARFIPAPIVLRAMMAATTLSLAACAWPVNFAWFFAWRLLSGVAGGAMMILAAPTVLPHVPPARRGLVSGIIFVGVGLGIAASGTLVPVMLRYGLTFTWIGLAAICLVLTIAAWGGWPAAPALAAAGHAHVPRPRHTHTLTGLYMEYGLCAVGLVPHMLFLVVFIARGLGQGLNSGARYWVVFGIGAVIGPLMTGNLADRAGHALALRLIYVIQAAATLLPALNHGTPCLIVSSAIMGALTPGVVPVVLGRVFELTGGHGAAQKTAWSTATTCFATIQAASAYVMSYLLAHTGNYRLLFTLGAGAMVLALLVNLLAAAAARGDKESASF